MGYREQMMSRASMRYLGSYLLNGGTDNSPQIGNDEPEQVAIDRARSTLERLLQGHEEEQTILNTAQDIGSAYERSGFLNGVKVGARLMLNLLGDTDVIF